MLRPAHPEVLHPDWLPPVALGRAREVSRARDHLLATLDSPRPGRLILVGPPGAGTSTVARLAARGASEELRRSLAGRSVLFTAVRARLVRGVQGVATEILRTIDPGFSGRGFHATEILAGILRRLRREGRAAVVVVDDIGPAVGDLAPLLRAFTDPDRFLPEGESGLPPMALVLAGVPEARGVWQEADRRGFRPEERLELAPYAPEALVRIVGDRAQRALGRLPPEAWFARLQARVTGARGAAHAIDLLRRELTVPVPVSWAGPRPPGGPPAPHIEPPLLAALGQVAARHRATIAEVRRWEKEFALAEGTRPLPATTFWRRIVRLESVGVVHREVRAGGAGGTRSVVELLQPLSGLPAPAPRETPPAVGWSPPFAPPRAPG